MVGGPLVAVQGKFICRSFQDGDFEICDEREDQIGSFRENKPTCALDYRNLKHMQSFTASDT